MTGHPPASSTAPASFGTMRSVAAWATLTVLGVSWMPSTVAAPAHQHGVARLAMRYDAGSLVIELDSPLDNLLGFERPPASDAERQAADAATATLRDADTMFRVDPSAECQLARAVVQAPALDAGTADGTAADAGDHSDVAATYTYRCGAAAPAWVKLPMREAFPRIQRIELQVTTPRGQIQATLRGKADSARLAR